MYGSTQSSDWVDKVEQETTMILIKRRNPLSNLPDLNCSFCSAQSMEAWGLTSATVLLCQRSWATSDVEASPWPLVYKVTWLLQRWPGTVREACVGYSDSLLVSTALNPLTLNTLAQCYHIHLIDILLVQLITVNRRTFSSKWQAEAAVLLCCCYAFTPPLVTCNGACAQIRTSFVWFQRH